MIKAKPTVTTTVTPTVTRNAPLKTVTRQKGRTNAERQKAYRARQKARQ